MCWPTTGAPGCSCPTWPCTLFFGMTTRWWPYLACFLGTYNGYPAGGCHPPWYLLIGPTDWYSADVVAHLPSHCLGTDTFINGLLHASFQTWDPVWCPEAGHYPDPCIFFLMLLVKVYCWSTCRYCLVLPKTHGPYNPPPPHFLPDHSYLLAQIVPHSRPVVQCLELCKMSLGKINKLTALDLQCHKTLEVGVFFLKLFHNFWGDIIDALFL